MEVAPTTEMMSGVENPDDAISAGEADGLDAQLVSQLVHRARPVACS
jgi:hypothetical protein